MICAARFCQITIDNDKVFCNNHWDKLPMELKEHVADAYKSPDHDGRQPNPLFATAVTKCIGYLTAKYG